MTALWMPVLTAELHYDISIMQTGFTSCSDTRKGSGHVGKPTNNRKENKKWKKELSAEKLV